MVLGKRVATPTRRIVLFSLDSSKDESVQEGSHAGVRESSLYVVIQSLSTGSSGLSATPKSVVQRCFHTTPSLASFCLATVKKNSLRGCVGGGGGKRGGRVPFRVC